MRTKKKTKVKKEKLPATATSLEWRCYHDLKEKQKAQDNLEKAERKKIKEENLTIKKEFEEKT